MFKQLINWYLGAIKTLGYPAIALMMAAESTIVPIPSEVIIPPAAHWAYTGEIPLAVWGVVLVGALGSWVGATIMYWASRLAGRPLVMKFGPYFLISAQKVEGAERWASHYGAMGIFISRLLPVVRHLIGIPAGIVRMNFLKYSLYTLVGSLLWCSVLAYVGVKMGQDEQLMKGELRHVTAWLAGGMLVLGGLYYFFVHKHLKAQRKPA
jgi:membrane protein DedA with SNARE-associated domain